MNVAALEFEQPSALVPTGRAARTAIAEALSAHPGKWVLLGQWSKGGNTRQLAYAIRQGISGWRMFGPGFEADYHHLAGEHRVYVRYTGHGK